MAAMAAKMDCMNKSDEMAADLVKQMLSYLPPQSSDVADEYNAGEYVAAAHGAIHDLGILRADLPENLLDGIGSLIQRLKSEDDSFNLRFLGQMEIGFEQLKERRELLHGHKTA
jgi:hypothetical protein